MGLSFARAQNVHDDAAWSTGQFSWNVDPPLLAVKADKLPSSPEHPWISVKDPSIVRFEDRWHLFCTLRKLKQGQGRIRIGYLSFNDFGDAADSKWSLLELTPDYHGAPQIFYFEPRQLWYLIYQAADESRGLAYGPCYSTNRDLSHAAGWTLPQPLYVVKPGAKAGLDFWVICDESRAHLFFTTLNGQLWRAETSLADFPDRGWSDPKVVLQADIFEASHTYKLKGLNQFLTIVEAQQGNRGRYYKAYAAETLDGKWQPLADTLQRPFASPANVTNQSDSWADSYSHGEILRLGYNQLLEVDPEQPRFLFQGVTQEQYQASGYGGIPWRLGLLSSE